MVVVQQRLALHLVLLTRRWNEFHVQVASAGIVVGHELWNPVDHIDGTAVRVACKHAQEAGRTEDFVVKVECGPLVTGRRPLWASFEFEISICLGPPFRMSAAESNRAPWSEQGNVQGQYQRLVRLDLSTEEL